jgi:hypothetical protein
MFFEVKDKKASLLMSTSTSCESLDKERPTSPYSCLLGKWDIVVVHVSFGYYSLSVNLK